MYQMKGESTVAKPLRLGDTDMAGKLSFNPVQRQNNQLKTAFQVQNYAASKQMAEQGRTDMGGAMMGYSDTLG